MKVLDYFIRGLTCAKLSFPTYISDSFLGFTLENQVANALTDLKKATFRLSGEAFLLRYVIPAALSLHGVCSSFIDLGCYDKLTTADNLLSQRHGWPQIIEIRRVQHAAG
jgi:hypothetical protein